MTISTLIKNYKNNNAPHNHFFDKQTLRFFGESFHTMELLTNKMNIVDSLGKQHECYIIKSYQKNSPLESKFYYHAFDVKSFEHIESKNHLDDFVTA